MTWAEIKSCQNSLIIGVTIDNGTLLISSVEQKSESKHRYTYTHTQLFFLAELDNSMEKRIIFSTNDAKTIA